MAKSLEKQEKGKMNPLVWFLFAIVVPVIVAITLAVIIFTVAGIDVMDWAKNTGNKIPVISSMITTDEEARSESKEENFQSSISKKDEQIEQLQAELNDKEATIEQMEQDIAKLENKSKTDDESKQQEDDEKNAIKTVSSSFRNMDKEKAAAILENMDETSAVDLLNGMSNDVRGGILEAMDPEKAANLAQLLMNN